MKQSTSFCEQKEAKKLFYTGTWALVRPQPMAQIQEHFLVLFFKKELLPALVF
jgi:hypothetical protein